MNVTSKTLRAVLFDLDGTLLDTAPDLSQALNKVRAEEGLTPLPETLIRSQVSHGGKALIQLGFPDRCAEDKEALRQRLLDYYSAHIADRTRPFPGMESLLDSLDQWQIPWGIITNKPMRFTDPLCEALGFDKRAHAIISGDTAKHPKPHPAPMLRAAEACQVAPEQCVYIGDAQRDIEAGHNAGMTTVAALFGYLGDQDQPQDWQAHAMVDSVQDLQDWILSEFQIESAEKSPRMNADTHG